MWLGAASLSLSASYPSIHVPLLRQLLAMAGMASSLPPFLLPSLIWLALIAAYENSFGVRTAAAAPMGCVLAAVRLEREGAGRVAGRFTSDVRETEKRELLPKEAPPLLRLWCVRFCSDWPP